MSTILTGVFCTVPTKVVERGLATNPAARARKTAQESKAEQSLQQRRLKTARRPSLPPARPAARPPSRLSSAHPTALQSPLRREASVQPGCVTPSVASQANGRCVLLSTQEGRSCVQCETGLGFGASWGWYCTHTGAALIDNDLHLGPFTPRAWMRVLRTWLGPQLSSGQSKVDL